MARLSSGYNKGNCRSSTAREKVKIYIRAAVKDCPAGVINIGRRADERPGRRSEPRRVVEAGLEVDGLRDRSAVSAPA